MKTTNLYEHRWLSDAYGEAALSKHTTQVGAVIVCSNGQVFRACNDESFTPSLHAEASAIDKMIAGNGNPENAVMFAPWHACEKCAKRIVDSGIKKIVGHKEMFECAALVKPEWEETTRKGRILLEENEVVSILLSGTIPAYAIRVSGSFFRPALIPHTIKDKGDGTQSL